MSASRERVYRVLSDFQQHHPKILPPAFSDVRVEEGGVGAGTVVSFRMTAGGRERSYRNRVEEPEPGRVMTESDMNSTATTTFTVLPEGSGSLVRIETAWQGAKGIGGFMERMFAPRVLKRIYQDELERLDTYSASLEATT